MNVSAPQKAGRGDHSLKGHWGLLAVIFSAQLMVVIDTTIVIIALPSAQHGLHLTDSNRQWVVSAYTIVLGGVLLVGGPLADRFGARRLLLVGAIGFAVASALAGAAVDFTMLVTVRAVQGAFGALLTPSVLSILTTRFEGSPLRGRAFGIYSMVLQGGAVAGLVLGGVLTEFLSWRWCFFVNLPVSCACIIGVATVIPPHPGRPHDRSTLISGILPCAAVAALVYGLNVVADDGWGSLQFLLAVAFTVIALAAFGFSQTRISQPLIPLRVIRNRDRAGAYLVLILIVAVMFGVYLVLTYELQTVLRYSAAVAGIAFIPMLLSTALTATQIAGRLMTRVPARYLVAAGAVAGIAGLLLLRTLTVESSYLGGLLAPEILLGASVGLIQAPCMSAGTAGVVRGDAGAAASLASSSRQIGGSVGTALFNTIAATSTVAAHLTGAAELTATIHGYNGALLVGAGLLAVAGVAGWTLISTRPAGRPVTAAVAAASPKAP